MASTQTPATAAGADNNNGNKHSVLIQNTEKLIKWQNTCHLKMDDAFYTTDNYCNAAN